MAINFKKTAAPEFMAGLMAAGIVWLLFGLILGQSKFALAFQTIDHYSFTAWLFTPLAIKTPLILFWYFVLAIIAVLWLICLVTRAMGFFKKPMERPFWRGCMGAAHVLAALLIIFHAADLFVGERVPDVLIINDGKATFKNGAEISLNEMQYTNGLEYLNLPLNVYPRPIYTDKYKIKENTVVIGLAYSGQGVSYQRVYLTRPFYNEGAGIIIQNFISSENAAQAAGATVTYSKKPLLPFIAVLYIFLALALLGILISSKTGGNVEETAAKLPPEAKALPGKLPSNKNRAR